MSSMELDGNVMAGRQRGCYIVQPSTPWIFGFAPFRSLGIRPSEAPDLSVDPKGKVLSFINSSKRRKSFVVSVTNICEDKSGQVLLRAPSIDNDGKEVVCTTFLAVLPAKSVLDVCRIRVKKLSALDIASDIVFVQSHPFAAKEGSGGGGGGDGDGSGSGHKEGEKESKDETGSLDGPQGAQAQTGIESATNTHDAETFGQPLVVGFPLLTSRPVLCTQGVNGALTHFQLGTYHAVDFACDVGTPVVAVADGVVVKVQDSNAASGPHVHNLFHWNSILLQVDGVDVRQCVAGCSSRAAAPGTSSVNAATEALGGAESAEKVPASLHASELGGGGGSGSCGNALADGGSSGVERASADGSGVLSEALALARKDSVEKKIDQGRNQESSACASAQPPACIFFEYVHIRKGSARVREGQRVRRGEVLCESGSVGFCPEPHLHVQAHASADDTAPTVPFYFLSGLGGGGGSSSSGGCGSGGSGSVFSDDVGGDVGGGDSKGSSSSPYVPIAGKWYDAEHGLCEGVDGST